MLRAVRAVQAGAAAPGTTQREAFGDTVIDTIAEYAPNIRDIILHRQVLTPLDIEREFGLTEGNIFQGELTLEQLFFLRPVPGWAQYTTPIRNLWMCGSATHPAAGSWARRHATARCGSWRKRSRSDDASTTKDTKSTKATNKKSSCLGALRLGCDRSTQLVSLVAFVAFVAFVIFVVSGNWLSREAS